MALRTLWAGTEPQATLESCHRLLGHTAASVRRSWLPIESGRSPSEEAWAGERAQLNGFEFELVISHVVDARVKKKKTRRRRETSMWNL